MAVNKGNTVAYEKGYIAGGMRIQTTEYTQGQYVVIYPPMKFNNSHSTSFRMGYKYGFNDKLETLRQK